MRDNLKVLGTHSQSERQQDDYYATPLIALKKLWENIVFESPVYDPCVGGGHINNFFEEKGIDTYGSDIIDRGWPNTHILDFTTATKEELYSFLPSTFVIVTNPPYKKQLPIIFVNKGLEILPNEGKMIMLLPLRFLESQSRYEKIFSKNPPKEIIIFVDRINCWKNGNPKLENGAICYCWYIWEKGFKGNPIIKWIRTK